MSTFNICKINSMNFPNPKNPALFAGCDTCPKRNGIRPWNRYNGETCLKNFTLDELNMRRKAEILQYKNNDSNMSSKQLNARLFRGIGTQKKSWGNQRSLSQQPNLPPKKPITNSNSNLLNEDVINYRLLCPSNKQKCHSTTSSDVPGKPRELCYNKNIPLINYKIQRTYLAGSTKWPQRAWQPGDNGFPVGKSGSKKNTPENIIIPSSSPEPEPEPEPYFYYYKNWDLVDVLRDEKNNRIYYNNLEDALFASSTNTKSTGVTLDNRGWGLRINTGMSRWMNVDSWIKSSVLNELQYSSTTKSCLPTDDKLEYSSFWNCNTDDKTNCSPVELTSILPIDNARSISHDTVIPPYANTVKYSILM